MRRILTIYLEKPELAGFFLLVVLAIVSTSAPTASSSRENLRGVLASSRRSAGRHRLDHPDDLREFDLSVGSVFALMPRPSTSAERRRAVRAAVLLGLVIAARVGFVNGYARKFAIPSFITTLGMLFMAPRSPW